MVTKTQLGAAEIHSHRDQPCPLKLFLFITKENITQ